MTVGPQPLPVSGLHGEDHFGSVVTAAMVIFHTANLSGVRAICRAKAEIVFGALLNNFQRAARSACPFMQSGCALFCSLVETVECVTSSLKLPCDSGSQNFLVDTTRSVQCLSAHRSAPGKEEGIDGESGWSSGVRDTPTGPPTRRGSLVVWQMHPRDIPVRWALACDHI